MTRFANFGDIVKYVALLAFNKIVLTHPWLVAQQEDVILECIDSADISIRIKALDLVQGMVSGDNLVSIVGRLMRQLKLSSGDRRTTNHSGQAPGIQMTKTLRGQLIPLQNRRTNPRRFQMTTEPM